MIYNIYLNFPRIIMEHKKPFNVHKNSKNHQPPLGKENWLPYIDYEPEYILDEHGFKITKEFKNRNGIICWYRPEPERKCSYNSPIDWTGQYPPCSVHPYYDDNGFRECDWCEWFNKRPWDVIFGLGHFGAFQNIQGN
jgi:hypothetical protein